MVDGIRCQSGLNIVRNSEAICGSVPHWLSRGDDRPELQLLRRGFIFSCQFFHIYSSLLSFFLYVFYFILASPMRKYSGKHSCMSSKFPIAILNAPFFARRNVLCCGKSFAYQN